MGQSINQPSVTTSTINFEHPTIEKTVRYLADTIVGRYGFTENDREDVEQDLRADLLKYAATYKPEHASWPTYAVRVLNGAACDLITTRMAKKRQRVDQPIGEGDQQDDQHGDGQAWVDPSATRIQRHHELRLDVGAVMAGLCEVDRRIASLLMHETPSETARILGVKRHVIYESIASIKKAFTKAGLDLAA